MKSFFFKIIYGIFYAFSLLPLPVLYIFSDIAAFFLCDVLRYRKKIVLGNLQIAFPEKSDAERKKIAGNFYTRFCDNFLETIKLLSISEKELNKRFVADAKILDELHENCDKNITLALGHFFNWEMANLAFGLHNPFQQLLIYRKIQNSFFEKFMEKLRERYGTRLIATEEFQIRFRNFTGQRYCLILVADQNPPYKQCSRAFWTTFFGRLVPFVKGPEKGAVINDNVVVFGKITRIKRGYYKNELVLITDNARDTKRGEITVKTARLIEENIRKDPANYLWSHRRFKHEYRQELARNLIDLRPLNDGA